MKAAVEPETIQIAVYPQKRFLVNILRVLRGPQQVHREPEHTLVVGAYELPEGVLIASLSSPYERLLVCLKARVLGQRGGSATHVSTTQYIRRQERGKVTAQIRAGAINVLLTVS
jgi:hypothetical protein